MIPKRLLALTLFAALAVMPPCVLRAQWVQTNGLFGGDITALTSINGIIFAGTQNNGVYRSSNNGGSWNAVNGGLPDTNNIDLVTLNGDLFVLAWGEYIYGGIFHSTDSGRSWNAINLNARYIQALWADGRDLFAAGDDTLFRSTDNGLTWKASSFANGLPETNTSGVAEIGSIIFAATPGGVFLSSDSGATWTISGMLATTNSIISHGSNLFASTYFDGVFLSTDSGANWSPVNSGLPSDTMVTAFSWVDSTLFAGTAGSGVFSSSDNGSTWHRAGLPNGNIQTLLALGSNLYAGDEVNGVFLSTNLGNIWTALNTGLPNSQIPALGVNDTDIYATTGGGSVFLSTDNGTSWNTVYFPPPFTALLTFVIDQFTTDLFVGVGSTVERTTDNGMSWIGTDLGFNVTSLAAAGYALLAGTDSGGIFLSTDFGNSWLNSGLLVDSSNFLTNLPNTSLAVIGTNLFAGIYGQGILLTTDTGTTWNTVNAGLTDLNVNALCAVGTTLFAGTQNGGVFLSTNSGANWMSVNEGLTDSAILTFAVSDTNLWVGTYRKGIWRRPLSQLIPPLNAVAETLPESDAIQSYPNPFSQSTQITFTSPTSGYTEVSIVNMLGVEVAQLFSGELGAGEHNFTWSNPTGLQDGMYECLVRMNGQVETLPVLLMK